MIDKDNVETLLTNYLNINISQVYTDKFKTRFDKRYRIYEQNIIWYYGCRRREINKRADKIATSSRLYSMLQRIS